MFINSTSVIDNFNKLSSDFFELHLNVRGTSIEGVLRMEILSC